MGEIFVNKLSLQLAAACSSSDTTLTLAGQYAQLPAGPGNCRVRVDGELMAATLPIVGNVLTVARGQEGTTAVAHLLEAQVYPVLTAAALLAALAVAAGAGIDVEGNGSPVVDAATTINFTGCSVTNVGGVATVAVSYSPNATLVRVDHTTTGTVTLAAGQTAWVDLSGGALSATIAFPPSPSDGAKVRIVNANGSAATHPFQPNANGSTAEDPSAAPGTYTVTPTFNIAGASLEWTYDDTLSRWKLT